MKRRGGPPRKDGHKDTIFKKPKQTASPASSGGRRGAKPSKLDAKSKGEPKDDILEDEMLDGDVFFGESALENRTNKEMDISGSESDEENADEARLRQGKEYLSKIMRKTDPESSDDDTDDEMDIDEITARVAEDALQATGKMTQRQKADSLKGVKGSSFEIRVLRGHKQPVTAIRVSDDETTVYSASKDCCIVKWDLETGKKLAIYKGRRNVHNDTAQDESLAEKYPGHGQHIFALALTSDGNYLASGGKDKTILIWDTVKNTVRDGFKGHKDSVTALAFRLGSHDLYSGSDDRTLKMWNVDEMSYLDTVFGHKAEITAMDCLARERPVTSSLDKTAAVWKVADEVHLEYLGPKTQLFSIALLTEDIFVTGGQDGTIHLWSTQKRKPLFDLKVAHGPTPLDSVNWITSLAALRYSDLFASGSGTGEIKLWKLSASKDSFSLINTIPMIGIVNSLQFTKSGKYLLAGIGQEPKMGRWVRIPAARNGTAIIRLQK